jgi:hypothetical protein
MREKPGLPACWKNEIREIMSVSGEYWRIMAKLSGAGKKCLLPFLVCFPLVKALSGIWAHNSRAKESARNHGKPWAKKQKTVERPKWSSSSSVVSFGAR